MQSLIQLPKSLGKLIDAKVVLIDKLLSLNTLNAMLILFTNTNLFNKYLKKNDLFRAQCVKLEKLQVYFAKILFFSEIVSMLSYKTIINIKLICIGQTIIFSKIIQIV